MIRVLVSPANVDEALECIRGGASIIDVKNPAEGSLGANYPWVIKSIADVAKSNGREVSATVGDLDKPGTASLASLGVASLGVDYVKVGVMVGRKERAEKILRCVKRAVDGFDVKVVCGCYSDWKRANTVDPMKMADISGNLEIDGLLLDTAIKDGLSTFDFMDVNKIAELMDRVRSYGMFFALAGGISWRHIGIVKELKPDILGVRTMVCEGGRMSSIREHLVRRLVEEISR